MERAAVLKRRGRVAGGTNVNPRRKRARILRIFSLPSLRMNLRLKRRRREKSPRKRRVKPRKRFLMVGVRKARYFQRLRG